jgi:multidrug/hemolysin transport system permease protein
MATLLSLAGRNVKVFLRDRTAVFFSMISVFIIIGLYAVFLGSTTVRGLESAVGGNIEGIRWLVDSWIMAGILVVNSITVTLGAFGIMIDDESKKRLGGFLVAPISRTTLVAGYLLAANIVGFLLSLITLVLAEIYIVSGGGALLTLTALLKVIGLLAYNVVCSSCITFFLVSLVRTASGFATLSTILGTVIGFLTGIYLPIGALPEALQTVIKFVPATHAAALMRQIMTEAALEKVFSKAPPQIYEEFTTAYGVRVFFGGKEVLPPMMLLIIGVSGIIFLGLSVILMKRRKLG